MRSSGAGLGPLIRQHAAHLLPASSSSRPRAFAQQQAGPWRVIEIKKGEDLWLLGAGDSSSLVGRFYTAAGGAGPGPAYLRSLAFRRGVAKVQIDLAGSQGAPWQLTGEWLVGWLKRQGEGRGGSAAAATAWLWTHNG